MKVGVLVVAYNAESTLRWVLDRIPASLRTELVEVLVMDDHSADGTYAVAHEYIADGTDIPLTIVRHEHNLGYGGNQKAGYRYAIDHGWDVVVLLHGDGQYAPEKMPDLLAPFDRNPTVDAVFGSRMLDPGGARRGGMPMYKYVGNRILTRTQNLIAGVRPERVALRAIAPIGCRRWPSCRSSATATGSTSTPRSSCNCSATVAGSPRCRSRPTTATRSPGSTAWSTPATS